MNKTIPPLPPGSLPQPAPVSRVYRHLTCGTLTEVSGQAFLQICNPFTMCMGTICSSCVLPAALDEVAWADTGEIISVYRQRMFEETPWRISLLPWLLAVPGAILGLVVALPLFHGIVGLIYMTFLAVFIAAGAGSFILIGLALRMALAHDYRGRK